MSCGPTLGFSQIGMYSNMSGFSDVLYDEKNIYCSLGSIADFS